MCIFIRYIVTSSGAVLMYPAGVNDHRLNVLKRNWYLRAVQSPGLVTVTPPYLDAAGAGYVVTISIAVGQYPLLFVMALDLTLGKSQYFNVLLFDLNRYNQES